ncbi:MAG: NAD(P)H-hydrate dehydratase [Paucibacter sp.]|nr:NAD(P)H-hydrate dehydratase [Roseateles sp.]
MERAGLAAARLAMALAPSNKGTIWLACGPGNNGGDGLIAARLLHQNGIDVRVSLLRGNNKAPAAAAAALSAAQAAGVAISHVMQAPPDTCLAIDALLGLGLSRAPSPEIAAGIAALNGLGAPVLALDLPSGLHPDTGSLTGEAAVRAQHCLALLTLKPGLFTGAGRAHCGELWFDDLGVTSAPIGDSLLLGGQGLSAWRDQAAAADNHAKHKGSQGDVLVIGGAPGMRGAARLAARAALAAGAGRVYACLLNSTQTNAAPDDVDPQRPELMQFPQTRLDEPSALSTWSQKTIVCGCGGGDAIAIHLAQVLRHAQRLVLDADALNAVALDAALRTRLKQRRTAGLATVLTPHPLEAARLLCSSAAAVQADRIGAAQALVDDLSCQVILKGSGSIIAGLHRQPAINSSGNAALATPGSGDVLAGWLGGLWAQQATADPFDLACLACYWHGAAALSQTSGPLRAADLVERMHALHTGPKLS